MAFQIGPFLNLATGLLLLMQRIISEVLTCSGLHFWAEYERGSTGHVPAGQMGCPW